MEGVVQHLMIITVSFVLLCQLQSLISSCLACSVHDRTALIQFAESLTIFDPYDCLFYNKELSYRYPEADAEGPCAWMEPCLPNPRPKTKSWNRQSEEEEDCCKWEGVRCNRWNGEVIGLDLSCSQLQGTFPPNSSLFQLSHLRTLNLAFNNFSYSHIPPDMFHRLPSLTHLNLSYSFFIGDIPLPDISRLSKLVSLDLSDNFGLNLQPWCFSMLLVQNLDVLSLSNVNISSQLPKNLSSSFTYLDLGYTYLYGKVPESIFHLPHLQTLILHGNSELTGALPHANWSSSDSLERLDVYATSFYGIIPALMLGNLKSLNYLDLSRSQISGSIPESIGKLTSLQHLELTSSQVSGVIPNSIGNLTSLNYIDLSYTYLSGRIPNSIGNLISLNYIYLSNTYLSGPIPNSIDNLTSLNYIDLGNTNLYGPIPNSIGNLTSLHYIYLSYTYLSGPIPNSIGNLTSLNYIYLSNTKLSGPIPNTIGNLTSLNYIDLSNTNLYGPIPNSIGNLKSLHFLMMSDCKFSGPLPRSIGDLTQVEELYLSRNNFIGELPPSITNMTRLRYLALSRNSFGGFLPTNTSGRLQKSLRVIYLDNNLFIGTISSWIRSLPSLERLELSYNQLTGQIGEFKSKSLEAIGLSENKLNGPIPHSIFMLVNLTYINLASNNLSGRVLSSLFSNITQLYSIIDLSHNSLSLIINNYTFASSLYFLGLSSCGIQVSSDFLENLSPSLNFLDLSNNQIYGALPNFSRWEQLYVLDLSHNKLYGSFPSSICKFRIPYLFDLSHNNLSGTIPKCLFNNSDTGVFNLRHNNFHGSIMVFGYDLCSFTNVDLSYNQIEGSLPRSLANCTELQVLNLRNNYISDIFPTWLETLPNLQVLILRSNKFHGSITPSTATSHPFPQLRILDLAFNSFSGVLPWRYFENFRAMISIYKQQNPTEPEYMEEQYYDNLNYRFSVNLVIKGNEYELLAILKVFTTIDLSSNKFQGVVPEVIGKLKSLRLLNLSHNNLDGRIPSAMGNLAMLEQLDLSGNQLEGAIPEQLARLTFLQVLNLSENHLTGKIPRGKQFDTFQNDSYDGNPGLCGLPLSKQCEDRNGNPSPEAEEATDFFIGFTWRVVLMGYGCGIFLGVLLGSIAFLSGKPEWFNRIVEEEGHKILMRRRKKKIQGRRQLNR